MEVKIFLHWVRLLLNKKQREGKIIDSATIVRMMVEAERRRKAA